MGTGSEHAANAGDRNAAARLLPAVYDDLRSMAAALLRGRGSATLQPTVLVHEAFMKLSAASRQDWADESHFRAVAALAMRQILADHVRARTARKRGSGGRVAIDLDLFGVAHAGDPIELDSAIRELEAATPRAAQLLIFRFSVI